MKNWSAWNYNIYLQLNNYFNSSMTFIYRPSFSFDSLLQSCIMSSNQTFFCYPHTACPNQLTFDLVWFEPLWNTLNGLWCCQNRPNRKIRFCKPVVSSFFTWHTFSVAIASFCVGCCICSFRRPFDLFFFFRLSFSYSKRKKGNKLWIDSCSEIHFIDVDFS